MQKWMGHLMRALDVCLSIALPVLILAAAAVWSGTLGGHSLVSERPDMDDSTAEAVELLHTQMQAMGWGDCRVQQVDSATWIVLEASEDKERARWICSEKIAADIQGFAGATPLCLMLSPEGKVLKMVAQENAETKDYFDEAWQHILPQCEGKTLAELHANKIDGLTGATYTSESLIKNISVAKGHWLSADKIPEQKWHFGWKHVALLLTLIAGIILSWWKHRTPWLRIALQVMNVGVVGVWTGWYLSLSQLLGWMENGWVIAVAYPVVLILVVSLLMSVLGKKKYYCNWICPYGSAQELLGKLPVPKIEITQQTAKWMAWMRRACFGMLFVTLWMGLGREVLGYDPFSLFQPEAAAPVVLVVSCVILFMSMFVHRPWCRCVCPLGELLDMANPSPRIAGKKNEHSGKQPLCKTNNNAEQNGK